MTDFVDHIQNYASLLKECSVWNKSEEILAPVLGNEMFIPPKDYIYEFYCYLCLIVDLTENYELRFIEGAGASKYAFPKKAANKKGKPKFHAYKNGKLSFQICAGTLVRSRYSQEKNHPDISFQLPNASDDPDQDDLILIMDAKFSEHPKSKLPKDEVYTFAGIIDVFDLRGPLKLQIEFNKCKDMLGNCLITNAKAHSGLEDLTLLTRWVIKEVEAFYPGNKYRVVG